MKTLSQVLGARRGAVVTVGPRETIEHAVKLMAEHAVDAVLVMQNGHVVGVATEQDCSRHAADKRRVQDVMTPTACAPQQTTVRDAMAMMTERQLSYLPVLDDYKDVVGVVSMGALAREVPAA